MSGLCNTFVLVVVLALSSLQHSVDSANNGGCKLFLDNGVPITDQSWTFTADVPTPVKDTAKVGDIVYSYGCEEVLSITKGEATQPSVGVDYVTYELNDAKTKLNVIVAPAFLNYEKDETSELTLNTPVAFQCTSGASDIKFRVPVELSNNNNPSFADDTETLMKLPMPFPNGWPVKTITVTDVDIGNVALTLTLDAVSQGFFELQPPKVNGKAYEFVLVPTKQLNFASLTEVTVTAKDDSQGLQNTAVATLSFEPDVDNSTPLSPRFADVLYLGTIDEDPPVGSVLPTANPITITEGYDANEVTVVVKSAENADPGLFEVEMTGATASIKLKSALPADVLSKAFLILVLEAESSTAAYTGRTVVHFTLPGMGTTTTTVTTTDGTTTTTGTTVTTTECPTTVTTTTTSTTCPTCPTECTTPTSTSTTTESSNTCEPCTTECPEPTDCPVTCEPCTTCPTTTGTTATTTTTGTTVTTTGTTPTTTATSTTECPVTCEPCTTTGTTATTTTTGTTPTTTTTGTTECPTTTTTDTTECPVTCEPCTTCPATTTTGTTDCPFDCSQCPTEGTTTCATSSTQTSSSTTTTSGTTTTPGSTTTPVDEGNLTFEEEEYSADIEASYIGFVLRVLAIDDRGRAVTYEIQTTSSVIKNRVTVDAAGSISVNKLPPGTFAFVVAASVEGTSLHAYTKVTIHVQSVTLCGNVPQFEYALSVISVPENVQQVVIPGMTAVDGTDCVYSLDSEEFFSIDPSTGELTSKPVDRESELFVDMQTPQVVVHLNVQCSEHSLARRPSATGVATEAVRGGDRRDAKLDFSEIESVPSDKQNMTVVAIIDDANDNAPVFTSTNPLVIGYPSEELTAQLNPTSLVTVMATDKDIGINAEIEYTLSDDSDDGRFYVHPTSGTVYVLASEWAYTDQELTVVATDMAGEGLTSAQPLNIKVRILSRSQVTELLIEGALLEQVDQIIEAMSTKTKFVVHSLSASVLPSLVSRSSPSLSTRTSLESFFAGFRSRRDLVRDENNDETSQSVLKMIVYAVDGEEVVPSDVFKVQMEEFDTWTVQDIRQLQPNTDSSTDGGLVAAVIALGVIVAVMLIAGGVVFFVFYVRPRMNRNEHLQDLINSGYVDSNSEASSTTGSKDVEADGKANVTSWLHMAGDVKDSDSGMKNYSSDFEDIQKSPKDVAVNMEGSSHILTQFIMPENPEMHNDTLSKGAATYTTDSESEKDFKDDVKDEDEFGSKRKVRKKSVVTFNESVDCIEIEKM